MTNEDRLALLEQDFRQAIPRLEARFDHRFDRLEGKVDKLIWRAARSAGAVAVVTSFLVALSSAAVV